MSTAAEVRFFGITVGSVGPKLATALLAAQRKIEGVSKDAENPHYKSKFADLTSVIEAVTPHLNAEGVVVLQLPSPAPEGLLGLSTILMHESGEFVSGTAEVPLSKPDPQGYAAAMTYTRRISLGAATNLKFIDDDGESAVGRPAPSRNVTPPTRIDKSKFPGKAETAAPPVRPAKGLFPTPKVGQKKALEVKDLPAKPRDDDDPSYNEEGGEGDAE